MDTSIPAFMEIVASIEGSGYRPLPQSDRYLHNMNPNNTVWPHPVTLRTQTRTRAQLHTRSPQNLVEYYQ